MEIKNRSLSFRNEELDNIAEDIKNGVNPMNALEKEINKNNISFEDFTDIELSGSQIMVEKYRTSYSQMVCEAWNN